MPIMVRAMLAHVGFHQAKTITSIASMKRQKQNAILPPLLTIYYTNIVRICHTMSSNIWAGLSLGLNMSISQ
jgi:hypothetical protein